MADLVFEIQGQKGNIHLNYDNDFDAWTWNNFDSMKVKLINPELASAIDALAIKMTDERKIRLIKEAAEARIIRDAAEAKAVNEFQTLITSLVPKEYRLIIHSSQSFSISRSYDNGEQSVSISITIRKDSHKYDGWSYRDTNFHNHRFSTPKRAVQSALLLISTEQERLRLIHDAKIEAENKKKKLEQIFADAGLQLTVEHHSYHNGGTIRRPRYSSYDTSIVSKMIEPPNPAHYSDIRGTLNLEDNGTMHILNPVIRGALSIAQFQSLSAYLKELGITST